MVTAFVMIRVAPRRVSEVAGVLTTLDHVAEVYSVTGDYDLIAILRLPSYEQLAEAVPDRIAQIDGIIDTKTLLAFRSYSREDEQAAWDIGLS